MAVLSALLWGAVLLFTGILIRRALRPRPAEMLPLGFCFALGSGLLGSLVFLLRPLLGAPAGAADPSAPWRFATLVLLLLTGGALIALYRKNPPRVLRPRILKQPAVLLPALAAVAAWLLSAPIVLRPQVAFDVLSYHLPLAHFIAGREAWPEPFFFYYGRLPMLAFSLYAPVLSPPAATLDDAGVRWLLWLATIAASLQCASLAGRLGARPWQRAVACALFAWMPVVWQGLLMSHSDIWIALFAMSAVDAALRGAAGRPRYFLAAGFLAGCAVGVKFSALGIVAAPLGLALLAEALIRRFHPPRRWLSGAALFLAALLLAYSPWALHGIRTGGHPLHPFAGEAPGWTAEQAAFVVEQHQPATPLQPAYWRGAAAELDTFGWPLILRPSDPETGAGGFAVSGLLLVSLGALAAWRRRGVRVCLITMGAGYLAFQLVQGAPDRFVLPLAGIAAALAARALTLLHRPALRLLLAAVLGMAVLAGGWEAFRGGTYTAGLSPELWDRDSLFPQRVLTEARDVNPGALLPLFETRNRWLPGDFPAATVWDQVWWQDALRNAETPAQFAAALREAGITHVLVNEAEWSRFLNFYSDLDPRPAMGSAGLNAPREDVRRWLAAWPPARFSGFTESDAALLADFLVLTRRGATSWSPAGPVSEIWLAPLPEPTGAAASIDPQ